MALKPLILNDTPQYATWSSSLPNKGIYFVCTYEWRLLHFRRILICFTCYKFSVYYGNSVSNFLSCKLPTPIGAVNLELWLKNILKVGLCLSKWRPPNRQSDQKVRSETIRIYEYSTQPVKRRFTERYSIYLLMLCTELEFSNARAHNLSPQTWVSTRTTCLI
jgi:hypothetical protein